LTHFFRMVDAGLAPVLNGVPLLLGGVEDEVVAYRRAAKYPHIVAREIRGSMEHWTLNEIAERTQEEAVHECFDEAAKGLMTARAGTALQDPTKILQAAFEGRVRQLFIRDGAAFINPLPPDMKTSEDFVNAAVAETLCTGGAVFVARDRDMPDTPTIATLRY